MGVGFMEDVMVKYVLVISIVIDYICILYMRERMIIV
jgi:hypothetical protein